MNTQTLIDRIEGIFRQRIIDLQDEIRFQESDEGIANAHVHTRLYEAKKLRDDVLKIVREEV